ARALVVVVSEPERAVPRVSLAEGAEALELELGDLDPLGVAERGLEVLDRAVVVLLERSAAGEEAQAAEEVLALLLLARAEGALDHGLLAPTVCLERGDLGAVEEDVAERARVPDHAEEPLGALELAVGGLERSARGERAADEAVAVAGHPGDPELARESEG